MRDKKAGRPARDPRFERFIEWWFYAAFTGLILAVAGPAIASPLPHAAGEIARMAGLCLLVLCVAGFPVGVRIIARRHRRRA